MQWIRENWFWLVVAVAFAWMHLKMHGGHGSHGRHGAHGTRSAHTPNGGDSDHAEH